MTPIGFLSRIPYPIAAGLRIAGLAYLGTLLLLTMAQRRYIYHPRQDTEEDLLQMAEAGGLLPWRNEDEELIGWHAPGGENAPRVIVFHGNGGYALHRIYLARGLQAEAGSAPWEVFLLEYPGYGARPGTPSEARILNAATAALQTIPDDGRPLFLLGESLGTGVATALAARMPQRIQGLILLTPFTCLADVARRHYPIFPVRWLLRERYNNAAALKHYQGPAAFLLAENDEVVPTDSGRRLYEAYTGPKRLWSQAAGHNTLNYSPSSRWWRNLKEFLLEHLPPVSETAP
ncbi:MAG: alpha/beta hydrolase [Kiritimatiellia bacterium]|nr:alpha/beta hydrolase [Lentisphaerota bacterium]